MKKYIFLLLGLFLLTQTAKAQQIPAGVDTTVINSELRKRGLNEDEVRQRLEERGIDVNNIRPQDLPRVQKQIEDIIAELEQEKKQAADKAADEQTTDSDNLKPNTSNNQRKVLDIDEDSLPQKPIKPNIKKKNNTEATVVDDPKTAKKKALEAAKLAEQDSVRRAKGITIEEVFGEKSVTKRGKNDTIEPILVYGQQIFRDGQLSFVKDKDFKASEWCAQEVGYIISRPEVLVIPPSTMRLPESAGPQPNSGTSRSKW